MKAQILKLLQLKQLYYKQTCGECYTNISLSSAPKMALHKDLSADSSIRQCSLCNRAKVSLPSIGQVVQNSDICFISELSLLDSNNSFVNNKSAIMLQNIITRVFCMDITKVSILALVKCDWQNPYIDKSEMLSCLSHCLNQLQSINPKLCILLGDVVARHILGSALESSSKDIERLNNGRILWHNNKAFLITHSLNALVRNPSLKASANSDFLVAKSALAQMA